MNEATRGEMVLNMDRVFIVVIRPVGSVGNLTEVIQAAVGRFPKPVQGGCGQAVVGQQPVHRLSIASGRRGTVHRPRVARAFSMGAP